MNADGTGRRDITPALTDERDYSVPNWSPDGRWIATLVSRRNGIGLTIGEIYLLAPDGSAFTMLTGLGTAKLPQWSPDGGKVAFASAGFIYVVELSEKKARKMVEGRNPTWSPDGGKIVFERDGFLYLLDLHSGTVTRLIEGSFPRWYP